MKKITIALVLLVAPNTFAMKSEEKGEEIFLMVETLRIEQDSLTKMRGLLAAGASANFKPKYGQHKGYPLLAVAVLHDQSKEVIETLLNADAKINEKSPDGTALDIATINNNEILMKFLESRGAKKAVEIKK